MEQQQKEAQGTPTENLWKSELILLRYDELTKDPAQQAAVNADYLASLRSYLENAKEPIDGAWALDHAKLILTHIGQPDRLTLCMPNTNGCRLIQTARQHSTRAEGGGRIAGARWGDAGGGAQSA